ncbi:ABC transporter ATP-binding protein/permease [Trueperella bialowiezensis]|uniref:Probable ABC transporter ATP-binding protein HI_0664 n=1 Tax=Trueperella bialowiezensis TaxID=312285 RepID=A0A3S4UZ12_9ACTO|nr:ABC transporter ATP-binding protein [Trueperella bialowiezensis]VEI13316.1 Probable ABC transporter ATP-binding protein HI_0664 [Trueperella bialowiezensis]
MTTTQARQRNEHSRARGVARTSTAGNRGSQAHVQVGTAGGRATTRTVMLVRIGSAIATAVAVVMLGQAIGTYAANAGANVTSWLAGAVCAGLVAGALAGAELIIGTTGARREEKQLRRQILHTAFEATTLPKNAEEDSDSGALITMATQNAEKMTEYRQQYWGSTKAALLVPVLVVAYIAAAIDWRLGLGMAVAVPIIPVLVIGFLVVLRKVSKQSRQERARLTTQYMDALRNLTVIRLFGAGPRLEKKLAQQGERNRGAIMRLLAGNQRVIIVIDGALSLVMICWSVFLISQGVQRGTIDVTGAVTAMLLLVLLLEPLTQLAGFFYIGMGGIASEKIIGAYMGREQAKQAAAIRPKSAGDAGAGRGSTRAVELRDITYDYGRGEVLHGVSLSLDYGEKAAIIGRSGAGKSTLLSILRGSLPLQGGAAYVGGQDLGALSAPDIRSLSATVSQSTWLFSGTIADNLRIANEHATEAEMWEALAAAHVADDVRNMPLGLDTEVGERGAQLSGGQAQRVSLARALISGRKILFLDEPTSQIDLASEAAIIDAIGELGPEYALLIVTHRHSLLEIADTVYEMADGTIHRLHEERSGR